MHDQKFITNVSKECLARTRLEASLQTPIPVVQLNHNPERISYILQYFSRETVRSWKLKGQNRRKLPLPGVLDHKHCPKIAPVPFSWSPKSKFVSFCEVQRTSTLPLLVAGESAHQVWTVWQGRNILNFVQCTTCFGIR